MGKQFLYFFGERHSFDPKHPQWTKENKFWFDFVKKTEKQKRVAFVEGGKTSVEKNQRKNRLYESWWNRTWLHFLPQNKI